MRTVSRQLLSRGLVAAALLVSSQAQAFNVFACEPSGAALVTTLLPNAKVSTATTAWQDPHHIEARPSLISKLRRADLMVCTGAALETGWLPVLLRRASNAEVQPNQPGHFMMADHAVLIDQLERADRSMGDVHAEGNPHFLMNPENVVRVSRALSERLQTLVPNEAAQIQQAADQFKQAMNAKMAEWRVQSRSLAGKSVVAYHANLKYLSEWLGMKEVAYLEPIPGSPPTARHLANLRKSLASQEIFAILDSQHFPEKPAKRLSADTGVQHIRLLDSVGTPEAATMIDMFDYNLQQLTQAVNDG